jgi:CheY-like chemotaxis protein
MATILVIDDDPMAREIITEMLTQNGHRAINASNSGEKPDQAFQKKCSSQRC